MPDLVGPYTFVLLYETATKEQLLATVKSLGEFASEHRPRTHNPFRLVVVCGDSRIGSTGDLEAEAFDFVQWADRADWWETECDFGGWSVMFNLANIGLHRVAGDVVMLLTCGSRITDSRVAREALVSVSTDPCVAQLSLAPDSGGTVRPNGIVFRKSSKNLGSVMDGTVVEIRKSFFGSMRWHVVSTDARTPFLETHVVAAIGYDYYRDRHRRGEKVLDGQWAR